MAELKGYAAAQRSWEAMMPPEGGPCDCPDCSGNGTMPAPGDPEGDYVECSECAGFGQLAANGDPFDPEAAERAEDERADHKRNECNT